MTPDYEFLLTWGRPGHDPNYALTRDHAQELVDGWRGTGTFAGTLDSGDLQFTNNRGRTAVIRPYVPYRAREGESS
ncbi:hypothetical protein AB0395_34940 [Streptosporangium sp. NPDC051023]|uniref:hypothetical protein n=1 Tax=Streptosporangium sp. NPDC051023 TaxID=3155410 RepID=UPI00344D0AE3